MSWQWRMVQNLKKNWFVVSKITIIWWILSWALKILKIFTLNQSKWTFWGFSVLRSKFSNFTLHATYITFDLKKHRGVIVHDTEDWCKVWRETDMWFGKWHEEFDNCLREHSKFSNLRLWWDTFIQNR